MTHRRNRSVRKRRTMRGENVVNVVRLKAEGVKGQIEELIEELIEGV